ncbi:unnamed protein product [Effrenium voratum]|nr:unnamed protein product [Effrenium voratum]
MRPGSLDAEGMLDLLAFRILFWRLPAKPSAPKETLSETASVATQGAPRAATLERFPSEDYEDVPLSPLLSTLPDFCFQEGLQRLDKKPSGPEFQAFVFSDHKGGRRFVACLIVHERTVTSEGDSCTRPRRCA